MSDLIVNGGKPLSGTITPSGNKNSVLPIFCATLLTDEPVTLKNVPDITDLNKLVAFFREQGSTVDWERTIRHVGSHYRHRRYHHRHVAGAGGGTSHVRCRGRGSCG